MTKVKPIEITVTFPLPDWFPPERLGYYKLIYYPKGHVYYGQVKESRTVNSASNAIMKLSGVSVYCFNPMGPWITFKISPRKNLAVEIEKIGAKLHRFLRRYKESRGG